MTFLGILEYNIMSGSYNLFIQSLIGIHTSLVVRGTIRHLQSMIIGYPTIYYHPFLELLFTLYSANCIPDCITPTLKSGELFNMKYDK